MVTIRPKSDKNWRRGLFPNYFVHAVYQLRRSVGLKVRDRKQTNGQTGGRYRLSQSVITQLLGSVALGVDPQEKVDGTSPLAPFLSLLLDVAPPPLKSR